MPRVRALTPCAVCAAPCSATYCHRHGPTREPNAETTTRRARGAAWQRISQRRIAEHVAEHGPVCPGWRRPAHTVHPSTLTTDHGIPLAAGGTHDTANLGVLCRSCNSAKGARTA